MKNIIVAVWGSPGAGTSTFCPALAKSLARHSSYMLLCNANPFIPAYVSWGILAGVEQVGTKWENAEPLRRVLSCPNLTAQYVAKRLVFHPNIKQIALLGGFINERYEQYDQVGGNAANVFLDCVREFAQITLVDCMQPQLDALSVKALEKADLIITLIEPNAVGTAFTMSQLHILKALSKLPSRKIYLAAKVDNLTPVPDFENQTGIHFDAVLPYSDEARAKLELVNLFSEYGGVYGKTVKDAVQAVREVMADDGNAVGAV